MSHFSMFVLTKATVKLTNGNTRHSQGIGNILCHFPNCYIIFPVGPVYYFPSHASNAISSSALKLYVVFQNVTSEPLEHCDFVYPQGHSWRSSYLIQNNIDYLQVEIVKVKPQRDRNIVVPTICALSKQNISHIIHQHFGPVSITRLKQMSRKVLMDCLL